MKKIAYIEIDTHAEIAQSFMDIMEGSPAFSVDYYFSKKIKDQMVYNGQPVFLSDSSMILDQLRSQKYDLIIIGTVHRYFNTFQAIVKKYNTAVIVHNMNFINTSTFNLMKSIFKADVVYRLKLWWKEGLLNSSKVYRTAKNLLVLDEQLSSEKCKFLPVFYTRHLNAPENKVLTIVIPGGVSQQRRDYKKIVSTISAIESVIKDSDSNNELIEFVFLGKAKNQELKNIIDLERSLEYINITYFSERVSSVLFEEWMQKADVLWCPIRQETEFFSQKEIYGQTKMTGNLGDAIKFGKPAVFPENYRSRLDFIIPERKDLIKQFHELAGSKYNFPGSYDKRIVQEKLENLLNGLAI